MLQAYLSLGVDVFIKNRLQTAAFLSDLQKQSALHHFKLTDEQVRRIRFYTIQSSVTNNWFSTLTDYKPEKDAIQKGLYLGALTPVLDSLSDDFGFRHTEMFERRDDQPTSASNQIRLAHYLYDQVMKDDDEGFRKYFNEVTRVQDISLKQLRKDKLSFEELYEISCAKGGYSTLLYRSVLEKPLIGGEEEAIYLLGGILQLTNDAFDVYKDYHNGQQTLFTNTEDVSKLRALYVELIQNMCTKFLALNYPFENKRRTLVKILIIISRGMVCLDQLLACQRRTDNIFKVEKYNRTDLICDMEKASNIMKSIRICNSLKKWLTKKYPFE